ncbi:MULTISPECIES: DUF1465 family protein [Sphingomonas]|uniref:DUF1465 family protein n=1 Tax=Sphingomonas TaxID=13687 RepID=UPI000830052C|nr:DUF1465 family protein [Sphingomonas sp. CCH10-B3]
MGTEQVSSRLHRRLVDALYVEAMLLADEARAYFDEGGREDREALGPMERVAYSCESLKVTTRLMHVIAWLLTQRAVDAGEMSRTDALDPSRRLGAPPHSDPEVIASMPPQTRALVRASIDLFRRTARLDADQLGTPTESPARAILERLAVSI